MSALREVLSAADCRARAIARGDLWIEAALIANGRAIIYTDSRRTREAACAVLRLLRKLRGTGAVQIVAWRVEC